MFRDAAKPEENLESPRATGARTEGGLDMGGSNGSNNNMVVDKSELSFLLDTKFETAAKRSESHIDSSIKGLRDDMENLDKKHDKKHADTNSALIALELKINNAVDSFTSIAATNASAMQQSADAAILSARAYAPPAPVVPNDTYNRPALPARLKLFAMLPVTVGSATMGALAMCSKADIDSSNYTVTPLGNPGLTRMFAIDFVGGDAETNALRASKAKGCLRNKDGSWLELVVPTPADGDTKVYINLDKSPKVERMEKLCQVLLKISETEFPGKKFYMDRATGTLKFGWTPIASIAVPNSSEISLQWNNKGLAKTGLDKAAIQDAFDNATGGAANVEWSS